MGKNILIIRSANITVIEKLIKLILDVNKGININLYCLVQVDFYKELEEKYSKMRCIILKDNRLKYSMFCKDKEAINQIKSVKFDDIYIPSSSNNFENFTDIKLIAASLNCKNVIFYNCKEQYFKEKLVFQNLLSEKYINIVKYFLKLSSIYMIIAFINITVIPYYFFKFKFFEKENLVFNKYERICRK